jgi:hypothetical protein
MTQINIFDLVTFEVAKLAKEKGFNADLLTYFTENGELIEGSKPFLDLVNNKQNIFVAPTYMLLNKWLKFEKNVAMYQGCCPCVEDYVSTLTKL